MSVALTICCENADQLLDQNRELLREDVAFQSESFLKLLIFPYLWQDYNETGKPNFFENLEENYNLKDSVFSRFYNSENAMVDASEVLAYIKALFSILQRESGLPNIYCFRKQSTGDYFEDFRLDRWILQAGYDYCVAVDEQEKRLDLREEDTFSVGNEIMQIEKKTIVEKFQEDFVSIHRIAETALRYNVRIHIFTF